MALFNYSVQAWVRNNEGTTLFKLNVFTFGSESNVSEAEEKAINQLMSAEGCPKKAIKKLLITEF